MNSAFVRRPSAAALAVAIVWTIAVVVMLWMPPPPPPEVIIPYFDKYVHCAQFVGIGVAWRLARLRGAWVLGGGAALGAVTEVVQGVLPWPRTPDVWDVAADVAGLLLATAAVAVARRLRPWARPAGRSCTDPIAPAPSPRDPA